MCACVHLQNITGVVAAISDLLCVKIPSSYEVSSTPERGPLAMLSGLRVGPRGLESRPPPMAFQARLDAVGGHQGPLGQMMTMRPNGAPQGMMQQQQQQQQRLPHHSPGEVTHRATRPPGTRNCSTLFSMSPDAISVLSLLAVFSHTIAPVTRCVVNLSGGGGGRDRTSGLIDCLG